MEHEKVLDSASRLLLSGFSWRAVSGRRAMQSVPLGRKWGLEAGVLLGPGKTSPTPFFIFSAVAPGNVLWPQQNKYRK